MDKYCCVSNYINQNVSRFVIIKQSNKQNPIYTRREYFGTFKNKWLHFSMYCKKQEKGRTSNNDNTDIKISCIFLFLFILLFLIEHPTLIKHQTILMNATIVVYDIRSIYLYSLFANSCFRTNYIISVSTRNKCR